MKTIQTTVYEYDELSPEAQAKAREWYRDIPEVVDLEFVVDEIHTTLTTLGFDVVRDAIHYSISYSQGDYAGFSGTYQHPEKPVQLDTEDLDLSAIVEGLARIASDTPEPLYGRIRLSNYGNMLVDCATHHQLTGYVLRLGRWMYRQLRAEVQFQLSDEVVAEMLRVNEYTFTAGGKRFGD